ncbi:MAG TPA: serine--tRNA ligase, partial [Bacilli bacterium]|nr:serine--tRNA ligase [Bacilli bacterium]
MIDINLIRENKELVKENIKKKFQEQKLYLVDEIFELDVTYRQTKKEADDLRSKKNQLSDQIG